MASRDQHPSRVAVSGATGLIGRAVVAALQAQGAEVTVLSRRPDRASQTLGRDVEAVAWSPLQEPAPAKALAGRDAVVHLAGEPVGQRWRRRAKQAIRESRVIGTRNLIEGIRRCEPPPAVLLSASAIGIYGARGEEPLDEEAKTGAGFLAQTCVDWEAQADVAADLGLRVVKVRTGVVLDRRGGALAKMLPPFRLGVGGPVGGGEQYVSWIHLEDVAGIYLAAIADERWQGVLNATAPEPVTNRELSKALGEALGRPAALRVPAAALRALYGQMAEIVTTGQRVLPAKALMLGYEFRHPHLKQALQSALAP